MHNIKIKNILTILKPEIKEEYLFLFEQLEKEINLIEGLYYDYEKDFLKEHGYWFDLRKKYNDLLDELSDFISKYKKESWHD